MSEIFSPGSVAGPQGPSGLAGSLANVKSLTDNVLPNLTQLFDYTRASEGFTVNADGTVGVFGGFSASPLVYCPGALYAITNIPIRLQSGYCYFAFYDANANFMSSVTSFAGVTMVGGGGQMPGNTVFPLPGTQTYVRFTWQDSAFGGGYGSAASLQTASFCAGITAPSIPSPFQPFGFETTADVNAKLATLTSNVNSQIATAALAALPVGAVDAILPGPSGSNRNLFDYTNYTPNVIPYSDGTLHTLANWRTATIFCPGKTSFVANIPIIVAPGAYCVCAYDAFGNFLEDLTSSLVPYTGGSYAPSGYTQVNVAIPLPGTQTYIKFGYNPGVSFGSYLYCASPSSAVFYAGTTAAPPPSLTALNSSIPFVGTISTHVKTASQLGCAADGSGDATTILNNFLATASATNPIKLIVDGMFPTTGLVLSPNGYTTIEGLGAGSGIALIDGTTQDGIRIGPYTAAIGYSEGTYNGTLPSRTATKIVLRDFTINPNSLSGEGGQTDAGANQPVSGAPAHATFGAILANATNILVDNVNFLQAAAYALALTNVGYAKVVNCRFTSAGTIHDGIHIDGPSEDIGIMNCDFTTGDDAIALNAPEGFGGDISRVTITNCRFNGSLSVVRAYTSVDTGHMPTNNVHKMRNVTVSNCTGWVTGTAFVFGVYGGGYSSTSAVDQIQDFLVENCTVSAPVGMVVIENTAGSITFRGVNFIPTSTQPVFSVVLQVGELVLDGVAILRNPDGNSAPSSLVNVGGTLGRLSLLNCRVVDEDGSSYTAVPCLIDMSAETGTIAAVQLGAVDLTHVTALISTGDWGRVTVLRGSGVMGTGAQVPDSVMDNNALYLSSNVSGAPSIKVGGTAKRLTLA